MEQQNKNNQQTGLPFSVILLALVFVILGVLGVMSSLYSFATSSQAEEITTDSISKQLDQAMIEMEEKGELPPEVRQQLSTFRDDPHMQDLLVSSLNGVQDIVPNKGLFGFVSFLLSLVSLIAGVGLFLKKESARKLTVYFLIAATIISGLFGYTLVPGIVKFTNDITTQIGMGSGSVVSEMALYQIWTAVVLLFAVLHGMLVYYLNGEKVKIHFS